MTSIAPMSFTAKMGSTALRSQSVRRMTLALRYKSAAKTMVIAPSKRFARQEELKLFKT